jgi:hypothetical protein
MTDNSRRTGAAIEAHYRFVVWFSKSHKFTIGDRIAIAALDVLDALIKGRLHQGPHAAALLWCMGINCLTNGRDGKSGRGRCGRSIDAARETDCCQPNPELELVFRLNSQVSRKACRLKTKPC